MNKGKVWLVGAGPSDEGLFTIKGKKVLEQADVVVYDQLVGNGIMRMIPEEATCIDVGKHAGNHKVVQERINEILLEEAQKGKKVVRLKGGDPFLFGRGGEELELLCENHIPFEVIPGITSAISVPAYAGIPVTHRDYTSSLHIITGHKKKGCNTPIDYKSLVALGDVTLVFLMSVGALQEISRGLIEAGMNKDMPAAILEKGTTYRQRKVVATIDTLSEEARKNNIGTPGIIVVGKVCSLSEKFEWADQRLLGRKRIIITKSQNKSSKLKDKLTDLGAHVVEIPGAKTTKILNNNQLENSITNISKYQWISFTSEKSVEIFFDALIEKRIDIRLLSNIKFAAIGPSTKKAIEKRGVLVEYVPSEYSIESLVMGLEKCTSTDAKVMMCGQRIEDEKIEKSIDGCKTTMDYIPLYDIEYNKNYNLELEEDDIAVFTSASSVKTFVKTASDVDYSSINAVCIGEMTAKEASKNGMKVSTSTETTIESLVEAVIKLA